MSTQNKENEKLDDIKTNEALEKVEKVENDEFDKTEIIDYDIDEKIDNSDIEMNKSGKTNNEKKQKEPLDIKKEIISWIKMFAVAIILAVIITKFIIINATVPTQSMEDTIPAKSRIMGLRLSYLFSDPERGDVIVFEYQFEEDINYVKRIIGLPGETVVMSNGKIDIYKGDEYVTTLDESGYLKDMDWSGDYTFTIPEDCYMVLGDNRKNSADTRWWYDKYYKTGKCDYNDLFIKKDAILGKVYFTYFPNFSFVND